MPGEVDKRTLVRPCDKVNPNQRNLRKLLLSRSDTRPRQAPPWRALANEASAFGSFAAYYLRGTTLKLASAGPRSRTITDVMLAWSTKLRHTMLISTPSAHAIATLIGVAWVTTTIS